MCRIVLLLQVPVPVIRKLIDTFVKDVRFTFHNLCSQHCFWAIIWFFMTLLLWMGIVFALAFHAVMTIGTILILCWVVPFFVHVFACCLFRTWVSICHINALRTCPVINLSARMPGPFARQHRHENIPI